MVLTMWDFRTAVQDIQNSHRALDEIDGVSSDEASSQIRDGCTEEAVIALENRLRIRLPPSYRSFLLQVDGCDRFGLGLGGLLRVVQVKWFREDNGDWISAYTEGDQADPLEEEHRRYGPDQESFRFRRAYLFHLLQIGDVYDGSVYLLNPLVQDGSGEWEAWSFANSYPGAFREPSFLALSEKTWDKLQREVQLRTLPLHEDRIISDAVRDLRRSIDEDQISPQDAVIGYIDQKLTTDDTFAAWAQRINPYTALIRALQSKETR